MDIVDRLRGASNGAAGLDEAEEMALLSDAAFEIEHLRVKLGHVEAGQEWTVNRSKALIGQLRGLLREGVALMGIHPWSDRARAVLPESSVPEVP